MPIRVHFQGLLQLQLSWSWPIDAKMSQSMSLLASILVFEGFLLVHFHDFLVLEQAREGFQTNWGVVLGERGGVLNEPNELPLDPPL